MRTAVRLLTLLLLTASLGLGQMQRMRIPAGRYVLRGGKAPIRAVCNDLSRAVPRAGQLLRGTAGRVVVKRMSVETGEVVARAPLDEVLGEWIEIAGRGQAGSLEVRFPDADKFFYELDVEPGGGLIGENADEVAALWKEYEKVRPAQRKLDQTLRNAERALGRSAPTESSQVIEWAWGSPTIGDDVNKFIEKTREVIKARFDGGDPTVNTLRAAIESGRIPDAEQLAALRAFSVRCADAVPDAAMSALARVERFAGALRELVSNGTWDAPVDLEVLWRRKVSEVLTGREVTLEHAIESARRRLLRDLTDDVAADLVRSTDYLAAHPEHWRKVAVANALDLGPAPDRTWILVRKRSGGLAVSRAGGGGAEEPPSGFLPACVVEDAPGLDAALRELLGLESLGKFRFLVDDADLVATLRPLGRPVDSLRSLRHQAFRESRHATELVLTHHHSDPVNPLRISILDLRDPAMLDKHAQGDAVLVDHPDGSRYLIDTGLTQAGYERLLAELGKEPRLRVVITHRDADHLAGLKRLLEDSAVTIDEVIIGLNKDEGTKLWAEVKKLLEGPSNPLTPRRARGLIEHFVTKNTEPTLVTNDLVSFDGASGLGALRRLKLESSQGVDIEIFKHPTPSTENRASLVTSIRYKGKTTLLTGDADAGLLRALRGLHRSQGNDAEIDAGVLKWPHHLWLPTKRGDQRELIRFLREANPHTIIFSNTGRGQAPDEALPGIEALIHEALGSDVKLYWTGKDGTLRFITNASTEPAFRNDSPPQRRAA